MDSNPPHNLELTFDGLGGGLDSQGPGYMIDFVGIPNHAVQCVSRQVSPDAYINDMKKQR